ncbi:hypothetical protein RvY_07783 [Ramazzottius varieornatus]|uniref:EB domain-containing protein n=1 Tax=Ramazzottius varieornatus TaxID=947166 RepID=A0A1D1V3P1_RAMVA|nr:hypothetical protein RvY_07783 [Ramazzottius varieornatus]
MAGIYALVLFFVVGFVSAANKNQACSGVQDCKDAGLTCQGGICRCWIEQAFNVALTWACDFDQTCQTLFPGHVCRPSFQCSQFPNKKGYCQPISSL